MMELIVHKISFEIAKTGQPYAKLLVGNFQEKYELYVWGLTAQTPIYVGSILKLKTEVKEKNGFRSVPVAGIEIFEDSSHNLRSTIKGPISEVEWLKTVKTFPKVVLNDNIIDFLERIYKLYSRFPAASKNHHAYKGGLLNHTHQMLVMASALLEVYPFKIDSEVVFYAIILHDYGKIHDYTEDGEYKEHIALFGHLVSSAMFAGQILPSLKVDTDKIDRIIHAILAHHGKIEWGSPVNPATQEAFFIHHVDMLSGHGEMYEEGTHMSYISTLNTTIIK